MTLILRSSRVLLREGDGLVVAPARVRIEAERITEVQRIGSPSTGPVLEEELDFGDRLITPAFVNAHTHLALAFLRGIGTDGPTSGNLVEDLFFHYESRLSADDVRAFSRMGAFESLLFGVGFVWDHYYEGMAVAEALRETGLTGAVAPTLQDLAGPGKDKSEGALSATLAIAEDARLRSAGIVAALGPHATDTVSPSLLRTVAELAEGHKLPVHVHLAQSYEELLRVESREGRTPLELLAREGILARAPSVLMAHGLFVPEDDLRTLSVDKHVLVYCPSSQMQFAFPAHVPEWSERGLRFLLATDCAASSDSMNLQKELRLCAGAATALSTGGLTYARFLMQGGASAAEDVKLERDERASAFAPHVTPTKLLARVMHDASTLHPQVRVGDISPGHLANLLVWDTSHPSFWPGKDLLRTLCMSDTTAAIFAMYVAGKPIGTAGSFQASILASDAYRDARHEADARLDKLLSR